MSTSNMCLNEKHLSRFMRKSVSPYAQNKGADLLRGNGEADQRLCFCYIDSTILLLPKAKISSLWRSSEAVQPDLCQTWL